MMPNTSLILALGVITTEAFLCSQVSIGTDINTIDNVVSSGVVQPGWTYQDASYRSPPSEGILYFYLQGLEFIGPDFEAVAFHHDDEKRTGSSSWLFMNVTKDEETSGFFSDYSAYKVTQECSEKEGGTTLRLNITFASTYCSPITINWLKVCGEPTTTKDALAIGFSPRSSELAFNGIPTAAFDGNLKISSYKFSDDDDQIELFLYMEDGGSNAFFKPPYINTDHEVLYPTMSGSAIGGGWLTQEPKNLMIDFNCMSRKGKKTEVMLVVELPYFHDIEMHFFKQCGASPKNRNTWSWTGYLFWGVLVAAAAYTGYMIWRCKQGENFWDVIPCAERVMDLLSTIKLPSRGPQRGDSELPDYDDYYKGLNVHTQYGTV